MLVSHRYKFIFAKAKKVASTTTEAYLERYCVSPEEEISYIHEHVSNERITKYGIIGSRMNGDKGSRKWYNHKVTKDIKNDLGEDIWKSYSKIVNIRNPYDLAVSLYHDTGNKSKNTKDFERFLKMKNVQNILLSNRKIWTLDDKYVFDYYIRQEFLEEDLNTMIKEIGLPLYNDSLPNYKVIKRDHYSIYYNQESKNIISDIYAKELDLFNYNFNPILE